MRNNHCEHPVVTSEFAWHHWTLKVKSVPSQNGSSGRWIHKISLVFNDWGHFYRPYWITTFCYKSRHLVGQTTCASKRVHHRSTQYATFPVYFYSTCTRAHTHAHAHRHPLVGQIFERWHHIQYSLFPLDRMPVHRKLLPSSRCSKTQTRKLHVS